MASGLDSQSSEKLLLEHWLDAVKVLKSQKLEDDLGSGFEAHE